MKPDKFLKAVFDKDVPTQERLDFLFDRIDEWLLDGRFERVNQILFALKEGYIGKCADELSIGVGFLTVTKGASNDLRDRPKYAQALEREAKERYPESNLEGMFEGLR